MKEERLSLSSTMSELLKEYFPLRAIYREAILSNGYKSIRLSVITTQADSVIRDYNPGMSQIESVQHRDIVLEAIEALEEDGFHLGLYQQNIFNNQNGEVN